MVTKVFECSVSMCKSYCQGDKTKTEEKKKKIAGDNGCENKGELKKKNPHK